MLKEVCVENFTSIPKAIENGADRIELCDNLSVGGTTVSHGVALKSIQYCKSKNTKVMAIIRPRGGNFIYNNDELNIMYEDILHLKEIQVDGVVLGCLNNDGWIDTNAMSILLEAAIGLDITFHMAFDHIKPTLHLDAIEWLIEQGVSRILTHGGPLETPIEDNLSVLQKYKEYAGDRIIIMPGGGITDKNLDFLAGKLQIREVHGTRILGNFI